MCDAGHPACYAEPKPQDRRPRWERGECSPEGGRPAGLSEGVETAKALRSATSVLALLIALGVALADDMFMGAELDLGPLRFGLFYFGTFVLLEILVFIAEGIVYRLVLRLPAPRAFLTSFAANLGSAVVGLVINTVFLMLPRWFRYPMGLIVTLVVELPIVVAMNPHYPSTGASSEAQAPARLARAGRGRLLGVAAVANLVSYTIGRTILTSIWMAHAMKG